MPATGFLSTKSKLNKIIHFINTLSSLRNIFAGRAGPRSIPSLLCPGIRVLAPSCGRIHGAAHARAGSLRALPVEAGRCSFAVWGLQSSLNTWPSRTCPLPPSSTTSRHGCTLLSMSLPLHPAGSLGGILMNPGQFCPSPTPSPAPTYLLSLLRGQPVASSVSDGTATEMLLPTPMFLPGSSCSEANRSQYPTSCCLLVTHSPITRCVQTWSNETVKLGQQRRMRCSPGREACPGDCLDPPLLPALTGWPGASCPPASDLKVWERSGLLMCLTPVLLAKSLRKAESKGYLKRKIKILKLFQSKA